MICRKRLYLLFVLLPVPLMLFSQTPNSNMYAPQGYSAIPPSPEVASLMKYNEYPVSYFTGQPQINLPIYVVRSGELEVPVSISYHGGGIKLNEHAGIIGLGWSLNAGGCISRTVHGLPDELNRMPVRGLMNMTVATDSLRNTMLTRQSWNTYDPTNYDNVFVFSQEMCDDYNDGKADVSNDIFHINAIGKSGTFAYDIHRNTSLGAPVLSTDSDIQFTYSGGYASGYEIKDSSGTIYEFNELESTKFEYSYRSAGISYMDSTDYTSAWHLSRLISVTGDTISFSYVTAPFRGESNGTTEKRDFSGNTQIRPNTHVLGSCYVYYRPKILQSIVSRSEIVEFAYRDSTYRELSAIRIKNKNGDVVRTDSLYSTTCRLGRLLKGIKEVSHSSSQTLYEFDYFGEGESSTPHISDFSQDEWGYFNGKENNTLIVSFPNNSYTQNLSDRTADTACTKMGTLYKIHYATGGYTNFDWEQNDYSYVKAHSVFPKIATNTQTNDIDRSMRIVNNTDPKRIQEINLGWVTVTQGKTKSVAIDISKYIKPLVDSAAQPFAFLPGESYNQDQTQAGNNDYPHIVIVNNSTNQQVRAPIYIDKIQSDIGLHHATLSTAGTYKIVVRYPYNICEVDSLDWLYYFGTILNGNNDTYGHILYSVSETTQHTTNSDPWGGLRVKSITEVPDPTAQQNVRKDFIYKEYLTDSLSSGTITELPNYGSTLYFYKRVVENSSGLQSRIVGTEVDEHYSTGLYSSPLGGSMVEYPYVWEKYHTPDSLSVKHTYDSSREEYDIHDASFYEYIPGGMRMLTSKAHKRGNLLSSEYYRGQHIYKDVSNEYVIYENGNIPTFLGDLKRILDADSTYLALPSDSTKKIGSDYTACKYQIVPYLKQHTSTVITEISNHKSLQEIQEYSYFTDMYDGDNLSAHFIKSKTAVNSQGKTETTYYKYVASDLNLPRAEVTVCDGTVVSAKKYEYEKDTDNQNGRYILVRTYAAPLGATLSEYNTNTVWKNLNDPSISAINLPEYSYRYNQFGNIVEISYNGTVLASYIWSYLGSHPIAEVKGMSYEALCESLPTGMKPDNLLRMTSVPQNVFSTIRSAAGGRDVTTIDYYWLVGAKAVTDASGTTVHYGYDDFGRLSTIRDYNRYFMKKFEYNYAH